MSLAAAAAPFVDAHATPRPSPHGWSRPSRAAPTPLSVRAAGADTVPRAEYAPPPPPPPSHAAPTPAGGALPAGMWVESVDDSSVQAIGSARHDGRGARKSQPRKSFSRAVAHPRSPCARAARGGIGMDAKAFISEVSSTGGTGGCTRELSVYDAIGGQRGSVLTDGSVLNARGELVGYVEADGTVGAPDLSYVGEVTAPNANGVGFVTDESDALVGEVDYGIGVLKDADGSTIASITRNGEVSGHYGARCGRLDGFDYSKLRVAAAYLALLDKSFIAGK